MPPCRRTSIAAFGDLEDARRRLQLLLGSERLIERSLHAHPWLLLGAVVAMIEPMLVLAITFVFRQQRARCQRIAHLAAGISW